MAGGARKNADAALIAALATGETVEKAAATARVSESTAYRRLRDPAFRADVAQARAAMVGQAVGRLSEAMTAAALQLKRLVLQAESEAVRLGACRAILELGSKLRESVELEDRIANVERQLAGGKRR